MLAEQVEIVHRLWTEERVDFRGRHYTLEDAPAQPRPVQQPRLPLLVGGGGGRGTIAPALEFADEYNTPFVSPEDAAASREKTRPLRFSVMTGCIIGATRDDALERAHALYARRPRDASFDDWLARMSAFAVVGSVEEAAERLRAYERAGCDAARARALRRGRRPRPRARAHLAAVPRLCHELPDDRDHLDEPPPHGLADRTHGSDHALHQQPASAHGCLPPVPDEARGRQPPGRRRAGGGPRVRGDARRDCDPAPGLVAVRTPRPAADRHRDARLGAARRRRRLLAGRADVRGRLHRGVLQPARRRTPHVRDR